MINGPKLISLLPDHEWSWVEGRSPHDDDAIEYIRADLAAQTLQEQLQQALAMPDGDKRKKMLEAVMLEADAAEERAHKIWWEAYAELEAIGVKP